MKKNKLFSTISLILSGIMLVMSGLILVHSAQLQNAGTSLTVNFNGQNVNYEVQGWYHVSGGSRTALVNASGGTLVSFSANEPPTEKTLKVSNTEANNKVTLTANNTYVLFTYKFVNTASSGAFGMEVSLSLTNVSGSNLKAVKYGTSTTMYTENQLSTFISSNVTSTTSFDDDFIIAGGTTLASSGDSVKYYYVLLEINDVTLPVNFTPTFNWTVTCSEDIEAVTIPTTTYSTDTTITLTEDIEGNIVVTNGAILTINGNNHDIYGNIVVESGGILPSDVTINGDVSIDDNDGGALFQDVTITGDVTLNCSGAGFQGYCSVSGDITFTGGQLELDNVAVSEDIMISAEYTEITNTMVSGSVTISGESTMISDTDVLGNVTISGESTLISDTDVLGNVSISHGGLNLTNTSISGVLYVSGDAYVVVDSGCTLGDEDNPYTVVSSHRIYTDYALYMTGGTVIIEGAPTVYGLLHVGSGASLTIHGGTYYYDVSNYVPNGYTMTAVSYGEVFYIVGSGYPGGGGSTN